MVMISYALISEIVRGGTNIIKGLRDILVEEQVRLENIIKMAEDRMKHAPRGNLKYQRLKILFNIICMMKMINQQAIFQRKRMIWYVN